MAASWLATELPQVEVWRRRASPQVTSEQLGERLRATFASLGILPDGSGSTGKAGESSDGAGASCTITPFAAGPPADIDDAAYHRLRLRIEALERSPGWCAAAPGSNLTTCVRMMK